MTRIGGWRILALAGALLLLLAQGRAFLLRLGGWPALGWLARPTEFSRTPLAGDRDLLGRKFSVYGLQADRREVTLWCELSGPGLAELGAPELRLAIAPPSGTAPSGESLSTPGTTEAEKHADRWLARVRWDPVLADQDRVAVLARLGSATWQVTVPVQRPTPSPRTYWLGRRALGADAALQIEQIVLAPDFTGVYYRYQPDPIGRPPVGPFLTAGDSPLPRQPGRLSAPGEVIFDPLPPGTHSATFSLRLGSGEQQLVVPLLGTLPLPVPPWGAVRSGGVLFQRRDPSEYAVQLELVVASGARLSGWELTAAGVSARVAPADVREESIPVAAGDLHRLHLVFPVSGDAPPLSLRSRVEIPPVTLAAPIDLP